MRRAYILSLVLTVATACHHRGDVGSDADLSGALPDLAVAASDGAIATCAGVTCDSPPASLCSDASTLRTYASSGSCADGACVYAPTDSACANGCQDGACRPSTTITWSVGSIGTSDDLFRVWGSGPDDVYVLGLTKIFHSGDGGHTWAMQYQNVAYAVYGIWGSAPDDVYVVGQGGVILHTADHGASWQTVTSGAALANLWSIWGSSADDVYAVGTDGTVLHRQGDGTFAADVITGQ